MYADSEAVDHEFYEIACDRNLFPKESPFGFGMGRGPFAASRKCVNNVDSNWFPMEYGKQFFTHYHDSRKFFTLRLIDPHEFTGEVGKWQDDNLADFLGFLKDNKHFDDAVMMFYSDHGNHINFPISFKTVSGKHEMMNPFMFIGVSQNWNEKFASNILKNE